jgi:hypothetical protein
VNGKDVWRSLKTDVFSVAQPKAKDELAEIYKLRKEAAAADFHRGSLQRWAFAAIL